MITYHFKLNFNDFDQHNILYSNIPHVKVASTDINYVPRKPYPLCIHTLKQTFNQQHRAFQNNTQHLERSRGSLQHITVSIQL